ncbi:MAG: hypothetical protein ACI88H_004307 [Cocleimonas sp.]|jgi:hypothetical protein
MMFKINNKICLNLLALTFCFASFSSATLYADNSVSAQDREEIARITNDARDGFKVKQDILTVLEHAVGMAKSKDIAQIEALITQVNTMSNQEILGTFNADFIQSFSQFTTVLDNLETTKNEMLASAGNNGSTLATARLSSRVIANVNLRNAVYTPICGSTRADTTATIIGLGVFLVAEAIKEAAVSGCGTVVVVLGAGGSPQSAVCSGLVAGVFQIARAVWEEFLVCQDSIDSAEILGTYQRAEDIFNLVNNHDTEIKSSISNHDSTVNANVDAHDADIKSRLSQHDTTVNANVDTHDAEIKANLNQHDASVKNVIAVHDENLNTKTGAISDGIALHDSDIKTRLDEVNSKLDTAIKLLLTPPGKRPGWNRQTR